MIRNTVSLDECVDFLNQLATLDPVAVRALVETRVACGSSLADHPTVQVANLPDGAAVLGLLGVLNGLFGVGPDGRGPLAAQLSEPGRPLAISFRRTLCP